jgi:hypothetical protein
MTQRTPEPPLAPTQVAPKQETILPKVMASKEAIPVVVAVPRRSDALTWGLLAVGLAIVALLAVLLVTQLRKPSPARLAAESTTQVQAPAEAPPGGTLAGQSQYQVPPATTGSDTLAQSNGQEVPPATSGGDTLAQAQGTQVPPATTGTDALAQGRSQNVPPATTEAGSMAQGEEESYDPRTVCSWRQVYVTSGSGLKVTPALTLRRPWRIRYYTGQMQTSDNPWFIFAISVPTMGVDVVRVYESTPNTQGVMPMGKTGTFPLTIAATNSINWWIAVDQGEFCPQRR